MTRGAPVAGLLLTGLVAAATVWLVGRVAPAPACVVVIAGSGSSASTTMTSTSIESALGGSSGSGSVSVSGPATAELSSELVGSGSELAATSIVATSSLPPGSTIPSSASQACLSGAAATPRTAS